MKKCVLVEGYVRGKIAKRVMELLNIDCMYNIDEVAFSSSGVDQHLVYEETRPEDTCYLTTEEAYNGVACNDEIFEVVYEKGYPDSREIIFDTPVIIKNKKGDKFEIIAAVIGMDEWGLDIYEPYY